MIKLKYLNTKEKVIGLLFFTGMLGLLLEALLFPNETLQVSLIGITIILSLFLVRSLADRFFIISSYAEAIDQDVLPQALDDEQSEGIALHLRSMYYKLQEVTGFVNNLEADNFQFKYINKEGKVGEMLLALSTKQKKFAEEERRINWKNEGLARFSELLRVDDKDLKELSNNVLSNLVKYIGANQGGLFIAEDDEKGGRYMDLTACYAYDKKKFMEKRVEEGQGLLGQVMLEKEMIFLTDVPLDFVCITSGLGEATPNAVVIVPLVVNDNFYGAIELASFDVFPDYKLKFLNEIAESIASTVATVKVNDHTHMLLDQSQEMAQELQSREEEMKQNMQELQATQEEMERGKVELDGVFGALNNSQGLVEFDVQGQILIANEMIESITGYTASELKEMPHLLLPKDDNSGFWEKLAKGENIEMELSIHNKSQKEIWLNANYSAVFDGSGDFKKILTLFLNITARKEREKEFERLSLVADNTNNSVIITDKDRRIEYVNPGFTRLTGYTMEEMMGKKPGAMLQGPETDGATIKRIREKLTAGEALYEEILNYDKDGKEYWVSLAINPVFSSNGEVEKYISVQADITETKRSALDYRNKFEAIDRSNAIVEFDMDGSILSANDNFLKIVKYQREEIEGLHHSILVPQENQGTEEYRNFWGKLKKGEFISQEFMALDKNKNEIWLRGIYNPLLDIRGNPTKVIQYATDITKEKQLNLHAENQRKELSSHLETLNKTIATIEFDSEANITSANKIYLDISGYDLEDLLGNNYDILLTEEEQFKPQNEMMWQSLMEGHFFTGQFRQKSKDGNDLWLLGTFNPVLDETGAVESIKMFAQFNTLEKEREQNNAQILNAYNSVVPVVELNENAKCIKANENFHNEFGISKLDLRTKGVGDLFETDFSDEQLNDLLQKLKKGQVIEDLVSFVSPEGNIRIFRAVFNPIKTNNKLKKVLLVLIDKEMIIKMNPS